MVIWTVIESSLMRQLIQMLMTKQPENNNTDAAETTDLQAYGDAHTAKQDDLEESVHIGSDPIVERDGQQDDRPAADISPEFDVSEMSQSYSQIDLENQSLGIHQVISIYLGQPLALGVSENRRCVTFLILYILIFLCL